MKKKILAILMAAATCFSLTACSDNSNNSGNAGNSGGSSDTGSKTESSGGSQSNDPIPLTVWGPEEDQQFLTELCEKFKAQYSDRTFEIQVGVKSEADAKDTLLTDVSAGADVFAFANDQLNQLIKAGALLDLSTVDAAMQNYAGKSLDDVKAANSEGSVSAASKDGKMYAFPLGAGNNYFLYYDKSKITENDIGSYDALLKAAGSAGKKVGHVLNSGWWNAGFFLGAGFSFSVDDSDTTSLDWNGTSSKGITGVQVVEGMLKITSDPAFQYIADGETAAAISSGELCAIVSGNWDLSACEAAWGAENVGASKLPTYTCNGQQVQEGTISGFKLMGVNGQSKQTGWAAILAEFLTNEQSQTDRFTARQLPPTNLKSAEADAVKNDKVVAASVAQDAACGVPQTVGGNYWDPTKTLGEIIAQGQLKIGETDKIQEALDTMVAGVTAPIA